MNPYCSSVHHQSSRLWIGGIVPESWAVPNGKHGFVRATCPLMVAPPTDDANSNMVRGDTVNQFPSQESMVDEGDPS